MISVRLWRSRAIDASATAWLLLAPAALCAAPVAPAGAAPEDLSASVGDRPKHAARVEAAYRANLARHKGDDDVLVLPGLIARRKQQRVELLAEATGLAPGSLVEFLLIDQGSDRGYEALLWSFARPSHVHEALVFVGMKPGQPFHPAGLRFWPKGERVSLQVVREGGGRKPRPRGLAGLLVDKTTGRPLPEGFVFTGSYRFGDPDDPDRRAYAADVLDPRSVASIYNEPTAVLDVPRRARQGDVYGKHVVGPECDFAPHEFLTLVMEPEYKDGRLRVVDLTLDVRRAAPGASAGGTPRASPTVFRLTDATGKALADKPTLIAVLAAFNRITGRGRDPFVSVRFGRGLRLAKVRKVARLLAVIDSDRGIRVEPPASGQLYYQAFLPGAALRDRETRIVQPWELRLTQHDKELAGELSRYDTMFVRDKPAPELKASRFEVPSPKALRAQLDADAARRKRAGRRPGAPVLMVFAAGEITYGQLMDFIEPALSTHNIVHIYLDEKKP